MSIQLQTTISKVVRTTVEGWKEETYAEVTKDHEITDIKNDHKNVRGTKVGNV